MLRPEGTPYHFLLVDDDEGIRGRVRQLLCDELGDCVVAEASSGEEALSLVVTRTWDAVILDIRLPGKSGLEILPDLRVVAPGVPIVAMSGLPAVPYATAASRAGAAAYVLKERAPEELVTTLRRLLLPAA